MAKTESSGERTYLCIDLKSFYASVECMERGLDPMSANLVVADVSRTDKTICLAVSPALKTYGIPGRARLFEVRQRVAEINDKRLRALKGGAFHGASFMAPELTADPRLELDFIAARPQMAKYIEISSQIFEIYSKYISPEDMHVYSVDEVFMDITEYMRTLRLSARELAMKLIHEVLDLTRITATAGIGPNLYLAKIAMDIEAKHIPPDRDGVRIAELTELSYRQKLWSHRPLTDFWRVGDGYAKKLEDNGMFTMGDIARCSLGEPGAFHSEELLYKLFGINAELLIDHAWGWEPCTIAEIKAYKPESNSLSSGQVLPTPYPYKKAGIIVREMADALALDLVDKGLVTDQIVLSLGYDKTSLTDPELAREYEGEVSVDRHGHKRPKHANSSALLGRYTSSSALIIKAAMELFDRIADERLLVRRVGIAACRLLREDEAREAGDYEQLALFDDEESAKEQDEKALEQEKRLQQTILSIKKKYGKNAVLKGMNFEDGATAVQRNEQIGGHRA